MDTAWAQIKQLPTAEAEYGKKYDSGQYGQSFRRVLSRKMAMMAEDAGNKVRDNDNDEEQENEQPNPNSSGAAACKVGSLICTGELAPLLPHACEECIECLACVRRPKRWAQLRRQAHAAEDCCTSNAAVDCSAHDMNARAAPCGLAQQCLQWQQRAR